ncbi:MAG: MarR family transcriptional regulator [Candidatus Thiodiazotropha sp.]|jgi:DNA-binding MarR family transcriptional regulator
MDNFSKENRQPFGITYLIGRLDRTLKYQFRQLLNPLELTLGQYTALSIFHSSGKLSNAKLAERIMVSPQAANELVKVMDKNGWIMRKPDPQHGRIINISLTTEGKRLLKLCNKAAANLEDRMLSHLTPDEVTDLHIQLRSTLRLLKSVD